MKKRLSFALVFASLVVFAAAPALADESKSAKGAVKSEQSEKGYGYQFTDDPLQAGLDGTKGFVIQVPPKPARQVLLKPRLSFVQEMLKSVEAL